MVEDDMARRVAGAVADVEGQLADRHRVAVDQVAVRLERLAVDSVALAILLQPGDPEQVVFVRPFDRHAQLLGEDAGLAAMVDMAVGQQDLLDRDAVLGGAAFSRRGRRPDRRRRRASSRCTTAGCNSAAAE